MSEGRSHPRGEQFASLNSQLSQAVGHFTQLLSSATAFGQAVNQFRTLEQQLALTNAAAGGTLTTFRQMESAARSFALATTASAQSAASALYFLAQAGFTVEQSLNALSGVMILAQATMQDVGFTSDLISSSLRTYNLTSLDSIRVANLFAAAQVNSLASLDKLAFSLRQVGPVASAMGQEIETTTAYLAELYNVGLRGEQAGTVLRNVMVRLVDVPASAKEVFNKYGISVRDATGELRSLEDVLIDIGNAGISESEAVKISGVEALAGFLTLVESVKKDASNTSSFERQLGAISGTAKAYEMAAAQLDTLNGSLLLAKNHMNDLAITVGKELAPYIVLVADTVSNLVDSFNALNDSTKRLIAGIGLSVAMVLTSLAAFKALRFIVLPLLGGFGKFFSLFALGSADSAKKAGLLVRAFRALGTVIRWMFAGAMVSSIINIGSALSGVAIKAESLRAVFTTLGTTRFVPLLAGIGAVGLAIAGAGGLVYAIYKIGSAWKEQTRITEEEVARQRAAILESAGISNTELDNIYGRISRREATIDLAGGLSVIDQTSLFRGIIDETNNDIEQLKELKARYEERTGTIIDLKSIIDESQQVTVDLKNVNTQAANAWVTALAPLFGLFALNSTKAISEAVATSLIESDPDKAIALLQKQLTDSNDLYEKVRGWIEQQFSPEALSSIEKELSLFLNRKRDAEAQLAELERAGKFSGDTYDELKNIIASSDASIVAARKQLDHIGSGIGNDLTSQILKRAIIDRNILDASLKAALEDNVISPEEGALLTDLQNNLNKRNVALSEELGNTFTAAQENLFEILKAQNLVQGQSAEGKAAFSLAITNLVGQIINVEDPENVPIEEIFGSESGRFRKFLGANKDLAITALMDILLKGDGDFKDSLLRLVAKLNTEDHPAPPELLTYIERMTTKPIRELTVQIQANRAKMNLEIARFKNELALTQADIADNLPKGVEAESIKAILDTVDVYKTQAEDIAKTLETSFGDVLSNIPITEEIAKLMGIQYTPNQDLAELLNFTGFLDGVAAAAASGAPADELASMTDAAIASFEANLIASLKAISTSMIRAKTMTAESGAELNSTLDTVIGLMEALRENRKFAISDAPRAAAAGSRYKPQEHKGRTVQEEALKLKTDFEKELRSIQRDLLGLERDILEFDNTIDFTARFTMMLDLDRKEIIQKYEQRIQEIKSDIEQANIDFAKQPEYLGQLVTGYNTLISQLERAKEAELSYTNTFTYQSKLRNEAIDRQIDAIRNLSMEGQQAGASIMQGMKAGLLLYQKDLKTVVDNVAQATVGVLDGLAEAVGAFVTGSGDALDILRNAVLSSVRELIVNSTKRLLQNLFAGITGGADKAVAVDPMQAALLSASTKTEIVYTNHLTQLQGILSGFAAGFGQALSSAVATVNGAGHEIIPSASPTTSSVQGGISAGINVDSPMWKLGKTIGNSVVTNLRDGIIATAQELQINPADLAAVISFETAGTLNPLQIGKNRTQYGQHQGLIQFGEPQAARFGADFSSMQAALQSQLGPNGAIVKYLRASGFENGMSLMDLYSTINAGRPGRYGASDVGNGGVSVSITDTVNNKLPAHLKHAEDVLGNFATDLSGIAGSTHTATSQFDASIQEFAQQTQEYPVATQPGIPVTGQEIQQTQAVNMQFLQQLQAVLMQFLQQFSVTLQQANAGGGLNIPGMSNGVIGGTVPTNGVAAAGGVIQQQMGGFMNVITSLLQSLMGGLSSVLQGLLSSVLGGLGGGGGFLGLFDDGGKIPNGKWGIAGENGPEIINGPATIMSRVDTQNYLRRSNETTTPTPVQEPPVVNNIIVQDPSLVGKYLATRAGRRQVLNIVNSK